MVNSKFFLIARNSGANAVIRGVFGVARIVMLLLIAKQYGASQFGLLSLVLSVMEIFKVITDLGVDVVSIRRFAAAPDLSETLLNHILTFKILLASISYLLAPLAFWLLYDSTEGVSILLIAGISLYTSLLINAFVSYFQATLSLTKIVGGNIAGVAVYAIFTLLGIASSQPITVLVIALPLGELVTLVFVWRLYARLHPVQFRFNKDIIRDVLKESMFVGLSGIIVAIYLRLDILLLGLFTDEQNVGQYSVALRFVEPVLLLFSSMSVSLYAYLSGSWNTDESFRIMRVLKIVFFSVTGIALAAVIVFSIFHDSLIRIVSAEYSSSGVILALLSWSLFFKAWNTQLTAILNSLGKFRIMTGIAALNLMISILLNVLLIPRYGVLGPAMTIIIAEGLNTFVQVFFVSLSVENFIGKLFRR